MTDVIKSFCATSTESHAATANLLREIIMVRDNFLSLPGWFTRDDINYRPLALFIINVKKTQETT